MLDHLYGGDPPRRWPERWRPIGAGPTYEYEKVDVYLEERYGFSADIDSLLALLAYLATLESKAHQELEDATVEVRSESGHALQLKVTELLSLFTDEAIVRDDLIPDLSRLYKEQRGLEARMSRLVHELRSRGATWDLIGEALGVSKQVVHYRYGRPNR